MAKLENCAYFTIYGKREYCEVIKVHKLGTVDVKRLSDGKYFRLSGLAYIER